MTVKQKVVQAVTPVVMPIIKLYWFVFRPRTEGAVAVIENKEGSLLLVRHTYGDQRWTFPGGGKEGDEHPKETVQREIREELNVQLKNVRVCGDFVSRKEYKHDHVTVCAGLVTDTVDPSPFEIAEAQWFEPDNLPDMGPVAEHVRDIYDQATAK